MTYEELKTQAENELKGMAVTKCNELSGIIEVLLHDGHGKAMEIARRQVNVLDTVVRGEFKPDVVKIDEAAKRLVEDARQAIRWIVDIEPTSNGSEIANHFDGVISLKTCADTLYFARAARLIRSGKMKAVGPWIAASQATDRMKLKIVRIIVATETHQIWRVEAELAEIGLPRTSDTQPTDQNDDPFKI